VMRSPAVGWAYVSNCGMNEILLNKFYWDSAEEMTAA